MKKIALLAAIVLMGGSCNVGSVVPEVMTVEETWDVMIAAIEGQDCETLQMFMTERLEIDEADCEDVFGVFERHGGPEIDWEASYETASADEMKVYMTDGSTLTTFVKEDNLWKADTIFWY